MYVLQRIQDASETFTPFTYRSDALAVVRSNYGISESEFHEFLVDGFFQRDYLYLYIYEGEIPQVEMMSARAKKAHQVQLERLAKKR